MGRPRTPMGTFGVIAFEPAAGGRVRPRRRTARPQLAGSHPRPRHRPPNSGRSSHRRDRRTLRAPLEPLIGCVVPEAHRDAEGEGASLGETCRQLVEVTMNKKTVSANVRREFVTRSTKASARLEKCVVPADHVRSAKSEKFVESLRDDA